MKSMAQIPWNKLLLIACKKKTLLTLQPIMTSMSEAKIRKLENKIKIQSK